jgi:hypothetical protein
MPVELKWDGDLLLMIFVGSMSRDDIHSWAEQVVALEAEAAVTPNRIVDLRGVTGSNVDLASYTDVGRRRREMTLKNPIKSAVIASEPVHFGYARMFQLINTNPMITLAIFPTEESARAWLAAPGLAPPAIPWEPSAKRRDPRGS